MSENPDVVVDPEFAALGPALTADEARALEASLVRHGCLSPLIVWKGPRTLLDGHNRLEVCRRLSLPYDVLEVEIEDRTAAMNFIDHNQLDRRNLTSDQRALIQGRLYLRERKTDGVTPLPGHDDRPPGMTDDLLSHALGTSPRTVRRAAEFARAVEVVKAIDPGIESAIGLRTAPARGVIIRAAQTLISRPDAPEAALCVLRPPVEESHAGKNWSTKTVSSKVKTRDELCQAALAALRVVAFVPDWPEKVKLPFGGGHNPSMPYDGSGTLTGGKFICFIVRSWPDKTLYPVGDEAHIGEKHKYNICRAGNRGALSGVIVAATASDIDTVYWMPWRLVEAGVPVKWSSKELIPLGSARDHSIDLSLAVEGERERRKAFVRTV